MKKRILIVFCSLMIILSLTGCGKKEKEVKKERPKLSMSDYVGKYAGYVYYKDEENNSKPYYGYTSEQYIALYDDGTCSLSETSVELLYGRSIYDPIERCEWQADKDVEVTFKVKEENPIKLKLDLDTNTFFIERDLLYDNDYQWDFEYYDIEGIKFIKTDLKASFEMLFNPPYTINNNIGTKTYGDQVRYTIEEGQISDIEYFVTPKEGYTMKVDGEYDLNKQGKYPIKLSFYDKDEKLVFEYVLVLSIIPNQETQRTFMKEHYIYDYNINLETAKNNTDSITFVDKVSEKQVCIDPFDQLSFRVLVVKNISCEDYYKKAADFNYSGEDYLYVPKGKFVPYEIATAQTKTFKEMYEFIKNYEKPLRYHLDKSNSESM